MSRIYFLILLNCENKIELENDVLFMENKCGKCIFRLSFMNKTVG